MGLGGGEDILSHYPLSFSPLERGRGETGLDLMLKALYGELIPSRAMFVPFLNASNGA